MPLDYFSDRELGPRPRDVEEITPSVWRAIVGFVDSLITTGGFGVDFPGRYCNDGDSTTGTDREAFCSTLRGEIPELDCPLRVITRTDPAEARSMFPVSVVSEGYAAFTVSPSATDAVRKYIANQEAHHGKHSFVDELKELLGKAGVAYDEKYLL